MMKCYLLIQTTHTRDDAAKIEENIIDCIEEEAKEKIDTEISEITLKKDKSGNIFRYNYIWPRSF